MKLNFGFNLDHFEQRIANEKNVDQHPFRYDFNHEFFTCNKMCFPLENCDNMVDCSVHLSLLANWGGGGGGAMLHASSATVEIGKKEYKKSMPHSGGVSLFMVKVTF